MMEKQMLVWVAITTFIVAPLSFAAPLVKETTPGGKSVKQKQNLPSFNTVNLSGVGNLYIKQSDQESLEVEADTKNDTPDHR